MEKRGLRLFIYIDRVITTVAWDGINEFSCININKMKIFVELTNKYIISKEL